MSLDLDERQRAMLEAMHVRVWLPRPRAAGVPSSPPAPLEQDMRAAAGPGTAGSVEPRLHPSEASLAGAQPVVRPPVAEIPAMRTQAAASERVPSQADTAGAGGDEALAWRSLGATIAECTRCALSVGRRRPVFQAEPEVRQADWLVVGEPPDAHEERAGGPFTGPAGQLLDNMLRAVGVARDGSGARGARITSVVKCRPGVARNPQPEELEACAHYLQHEIALVRPKVILAMGRFAAQSLLSEGHSQLLTLPFSRWRGAVHRYQGLPLVVTYHPAVLLRAQEDKALAWADLCLALQAASVAPSLTIASP